LSVRRQEWHPTRKKIHPNNPQRFFWGALTRPGKWTRKQKLKRLTYMANVLVWPVQLHYDSTKKEQPWLGG